jgi:hypothetical protein
MKGEFLLLVQDKLLEAEKQVRAKASRGSLTEKILQGHFGKGSARYLFYRRAKELAWRALYG